MSPRVIKITGKEDKEETGNFLSYGLEAKRTSVQTSDYSHLPANVKLLAVNGRQSHPFSCVPGDVFHSK